VKKVIRKRGEMGKENEERGKVRKMEETKMGA
jgi:hypothetical protein